MSSRDSRIRLRRGSFGELRQLVAQVLDGQSFLLHHRGQDGMRLLGSPRGRGRRQCGVLEPNLWRRRSRMDELIQTAHPRRPDGRLVGAALLLVLYRDVDPR
jgi:hypothetical protein